MKLAKFNNAPEIFHSIQGEGKTFGTPSVFVRLSHCNLQCSWCDTDYTWNWKKYSKSEEVMTVSVSDIAVRIQQFNCPNIVLTGGEPLLQQEELIDLMALLKPAGYRFEVETNATVHPLLYFDLLVDQYNCSPKLANSGNSESSRVIERTLKFFAQNPKANFKFVVSTLTNLAEIENLIETFCIPKEKIYIMPEGRTADDLQSKKEWLQKAAAESGLQMTQRLHIELFGDKRGV